MRFEDFESFLTTVENSSDNELNIFSPEELLHFFEINNFISRYQINNDIRLKFESITSDNEFKDLKVNIQNL